MNTQQKIAAIKSKLNTVQEQFYIQLGHPVAKITDKEYQTIPSVFSAVFNENSEVALLFWHQIPIRFSYTYGLFWNLHTMVSALNVVQTKEQGVYEMHLQTEVFIAKLKLSWQNNALKIESNWTGKSKYHPMAKVLNTKGALLISKSAFLKEWKGVLQQALQVLEQVVLVKTAANVEQVQLLKKVVENIQNIGRLYQKNEN